jgi:hypothetical protein
MIEFFKSEFYKNAGNNKIAIIVDIVSSAAIAASVKRKFLNRFIILIFL